MMTMTWVGCPVAYAGIEFDGIGALVEFIAA
jgi:hypothetical protein